MSLFLEKTETLKGFWKSLWPHALSCYVRRRFGAAYIADRRPGFILSRSRTHSSKVWKLKESRPKTIPWGRSSVIKVASGKACRSRLKWTKTATQAPLGRDAQSLMVTMARTQHCNRECSRSSHIRSVFFLTRSYPVVGFTFPILLHNTPYFSWWLFHHLIHLPIIFSKPAYSNTARAAQLSVLWKHFFIFIVW